MTNLVEKGVFPPYNDTSTIDKSIWNYLSMRSQDTNVKRALLFLKVFKILQNTHFQTVNYT